MGSTPQKDLHSFSPTLPGANLRNIAHLRYHIGAWNETVVGRDERPTAGKIRRQSTGLPVYPSNCSAVTDMDSPARTKNSSLTRSGDSLDTVTKELDKNHGGVVFGWICCVLEVLDVEEVGWSGLEL